MVFKRAALFRGRHFTDEIIVLCVRWYLRYSLSYRDLTEMMCERKLSIDPSTIWRWVQRYAPELNERIRRELKPTNGSWRTDETYIRVAGLDLFNVDGNPLSKGLNSSACLPEDAAAALFPTSITSSRRITAQIKRRVNASLGFRRWLL
jgi:hypothetical protein